MTNIEKIKEIFPNINIYEHGSTYSINNEYNFNASWCNAEYIEPTTKNDLGVDCISRAEMLRYQEYLHGKMSNEENHKLWKFIKALPSVTSQEPRWISVSERLPQESFNSIIGWDDYRKRCVLVQYIGGHFQITGKAESFDIKAWMPLPTKYEG